MMLHIGTLSVGIGVRARTLLQRELVYLMTCMCHGLIAQNMHTDVHVP